MYDKSTDRKKTESIITKMNVGTMTYVAFDTEIAEHMTSNYNSILDTEKQNKLAQKLAYPQYDGNCKRMNNQRFNDNSKCRLYKM